MIEKLLEKSGIAEVMLRKVLTSFTPLKKKIKRLLRKNNINQVAMVRNEALMQALKNRLQDCGIAKGDIVLIHSSLDGLRSLGISTEEIIDFILDLFSEMTVVFAAYPIEPINKKEIYKYNPYKTLCWTGMLPNVFLKRPEVIRSLFPYNTLAAKGGLAKEMMKDSLEANVPHGKNTPWEYCMKHHAKILFLGTTSRESNTMAIHMVPDIMLDRWPVENWYEERKYLIDTNEEKIEKVINIQREFWYQFVNEYKTDRLLKSVGLLRDISIDGIPLELVDDSYEMLNYLVSRCESGDLMYSIPRKYFK